MKSDTPRYSFILNEDVIAFNPKADKKAAAKPKEKRRSAGSNGRDFEIE
jgi:hypothetical protein